jgi:hypothetical protein
MCRNGAGVEKTYLKGDTPGFLNRETPTIEKDPRGFNKLELPRNRHFNSCNFIQTSVYLSQSWRANCDLQLLLYDSEPEFPDPSDIARVTDYIVSYACKGIETAKEEKDQVTLLVKAAKELSEDTNDLTRIARQILNRSIGEKLISKQECMVQLANLKLYHCSESFSLNSLSR